MNVSRKLLVCMATTLIVVALPSFVFANTVTYTYGGPNFNTFTVNSNWVGPNVFNTSDFVSGSFTVNGPLADGTYDLVGAAPAGLVWGTWSNGYATGTTPNIFKLTVAGGVITQWYVEMYAGSGYAETLKCSPGPCGFYVNEDQGVVDLNNGSFQQAIGTVYSTGSWKQTANNPVPEPGTVSLFLSGMAGAVPLARKLGLRRIR